MTDPLLVRDVMRIGVPTCRDNDPIAVAAARMLDLDCTALVVMDEEGGACGWINERMLGEGYRRLTLAISDQSVLLVSEVMSEHIPTSLSDIPLLAAVQLMDDLGVDRLYFMHDGGGRTWPSAELSLRDVVRALAGPEYIARQGAGAPRPTAMDLFRHRHARRAPEPPVGSTA